MYNHFSETVMSVRFVNGCVSVLTDLPVAHPPSKGLWVDVTISPRRLWQREDPSTFVSKTSSSGSNTDRHIITRKLQDSIRKLCTWFRGACLRQRISCVNSLRYFLFTGTIAGGSGYWALCSQLFETFTTEASLPLCLISQAQFQGDIWESASMAPNFLMSVLDGMWVVCFTLRLRVF
jgi:hypothetical protein